MVYGRRAKHYFKEWVQDAQWISLGAKGTSFGTHGWEPFSTQGILLSAQMHRSLALFTLLCLSFIFHGQYF